MSLQPHEIEPVPQDTLRVVRAAFPKGNLYIRMRDELGTFYCDHHFANLFPKTGQPALAPWRLALVTVMQFAEGLTDRQATEAVRARLDWKYALSLSLEDSGFDFSVLSEFRSRLIEGGAEHQLLELMLTHFKTKGLLKAGGKQRSDSTHVLAAIRRLSVLENLGEMVRAALNALAMVAPQWLLEQITPEWFDRYSHRVEEYRLPKGEEARHKYALLIGNDGLTLLKAVYSPEAPVGVGQLEALEVLRQSWVQHFYFYEEQLHWRDLKNIPPPGSRLESPYDPQARYATKREMNWTGYKVHLSETCEENQLHLITNVETTTAPINDVTVTEPIHQHLADKALLPTQHLVDRGYVDIELLLTSQTKYGLELVGPMRPNPGWQAAAKNGFSAADFKVDWPAQKATCPMGKVSQQWKASEDRFGNKFIQIRFAMSDCSACSQHHLCTKSKLRREVSVRPQAQYEALRQLRERETTAEFKAVYALRSGIEGTLSQGVRAFELRQCRYLGLAKTHLQHLATAAAINLVRAMRFLEEGAPNSRGKKFGFAALAPATAVA